MSVDKRPLVIIAGPTATGKSHAAVKLCKRIPGEVVSADSMQVYKGLDIGSAKVTEEEMEGVAHHLIDVLEPVEEFNVYEFKKLAKEAIDDIHRRGRIPVIAGGTGFYIQALLYDIDFTKDDNDREYRRSLLEMAQRGEEDRLYEMLKLADPDAAESIHPNNIRRVIRALEYHRLTGEQISKHNKRMRQKEAAYNFCYFVLNDDRSRIYEKINARVDRMAELGLFDEVKGLMDAGVARDMTAMQGIGYKEIASYYPGECQRDEAIEKIKLDTRHFAKRQLTWYKRERDVIWMDKRDYNGMDAIVDSMIRMIRDKGIWTG